MKELNIKYIQLDKLTEFKIIELSSPSGTQRHVSNTSIKIIPFPSLISDNNEERERKSDE